MVHADAVPDQPGQGLAESRAEPEAADQLGDRVLLGPAADIDAHQRLRLLDRGGLGEVDDVDRGLPGGEQLLDRLVQRLEDEPEGQRHRALGGLDDRRGPAGAASQVLLEPGYVAKSGGHQQELGPRKLDQRHLPGPAAVGVGVVMELVHDHQVGIGLRAVPQRDVGEHLGRAADNRSRCVDAAVAGHHSDVDRAEDVAEREEFLRYQRLDGRGVEAPVAGRQAGEVPCGGDQALARPGRRGKDDIRAGHDLDQCLVLVRIQGESLAIGPFAEGGVQRIGVGRLRHQVG